MSLLAKMFMSFFCYVFVDKELFCEMLTNTNKMVLKKNLESKKKNLRKPKKKFAGKTRPRIILYSCFSDKNFLRNSTQSDCRILPKTKFIERLLILISLNIAKVPLLLNQVKVLILHRGPI